MSSLTVNFSELEVKILLEALIEKEAKMQKICDSSDHEDEIAEVGNDLIEVRLLLNPLKEKAVEKYGEGILNFSKSLL